MAEIPVERKEGSSFPWWLIPLLLLLLLLPLLWFWSRSNIADNTNVNANRSNVGMANANNRVGVSNTGNTAVVPNTGNTAVVMNNNDGAMNTNAGARSGAVIKDVNEFGSATDKSMLVGRGFFVNGVRVNRVLSDNVFTVKSGSGEMFVLLDNNLDSPGGKEGQIKMRSGQNVNLGGEFRSVPSGEVNAETKGGGLDNLDNKEYAQMKGQQVYLHANSVSDVK
ncbi:MAG: hypothetical protein M3388_03960 [Acidobacteriota bacterium]|nr:hypothetical protein [Acidobacteriota bacterium]